MPTMLTALAVLDSTAASLGDINIPKAEWLSGRALAPFVSQFQRHGGRLALGLVLAFPFGVLALLLP